MLDSLIRLGKTVAPTPLRKWLGRRLAPWTIARWQRQARRAWQLTDGRIVAGPFKGMNYVAQASGSALPPKLLGTYELELNHIITALPARNYQRIVDIGGGEGYYAVGLSLQCPGTEVIVFEAAPQGRRLIADVAQNNHVLDHLDIRGRCTPHTLAAAIDPRQLTLVICDIEGAEAAVLDPDPAPSLAHCDILVELHELEAPGVSALIRTRFHPTHRIQTISTRPRRRADVPANVPDWKIRALPLLDELRKGPMQWFWMTTRRPPSAAEPPPDPPTPPQTASADQTPAPPNPQPRPGP